jgi:Na+/melibiose symporter-like transporter
MYLIAAAATTWGVIYRMRNLKETEEGKKTVHSHRSVDILKETREFFGAFGDMARRKEFTWFIIVQVLYTFALTLWGIYNTVFLTEKRGVDLDPLSISVFPILFSITFIFTIIVLVPQIRKEDVKKYILLGILLSAVSAFIYVVTPSKGMSYISVSYMFYAVGIALFRPLSDSAIMNLLSGSERTRLLAIVNTLVLVVAIGAGPVTAFLYNISPALNFAAVTAIFLLSAGLLYAKCPLKT